MAKESVIDILESLESDNSRLFKEGLLRENAANDLLRRVFVAAGDPYTNFYVNKFRMPPALGDGDDDHVVAEFLDTIYMELSTRSVTGNAAKALILELFTDMTEVQQKWCLRILLRNLRVGASESIVEKTWPGAIAKFSVQLAESLTSHHDPVAGIVIDDPVKYPLRVEPKLDGLRCIAVKHEGVVSMFTRNGSLLETLPTVKAALEAADYDDFVLDGEAMGADWSSVRHVEDRKGHDRRYSVDDSRLRAMGYAPQHTFDDGLAETVAWYKNNEAWWRPLKAKAAL